MDDHTPEVRQAGAQGLLHGYGAGVRIADGGSRIDGAVEGHIELVGDAAHFQAMELAFEPWLRGKVSEHRGNHELIHRRSLACETAIARRLDVGDDLTDGGESALQVGRASCRERV